MGIASLVLLIDLNIKMEIIMTNTGKDYELFVQKIMQAILNSETYTDSKNILVEHNKKVKDKNGIERQFDVLWDYEQGEIEYRTIIECKDYNSPISIEKVDALKGKLDDFPSVRGIIATTIGFQKGALEKAKNNGIDLLCIREQNDYDWIDTDGTPLVKKINLRIEAISPIQILNFNPVIDKKYIEEHNIDIEKIKSFNGWNNQIFIEDIDKNEKYSLFDLTHMYDKFLDTSIGIHEDIKTFDNAFIYQNEIKLKLREYKIKYQILPRLISNSEIDFSKELLGVVDYLLKGKKKWILRNGIVKIV